MKKTLFILIALLSPSICLADDNCEPLYTQTKEVTSLIIEEANRHPASPENLMVFESNLNAIMDSLNASGLTDEMCNVSQLSAMISQSLAAVSKLKERK